MDNFIQIFNINIVYLNLERYVVIERDLGKNTQLDQENKRRATIITGRRGEKRA